MWPLCNIKIQISFLLLSLPIFIKGFSEYENYIFEYNHPQNCKINEYFNIDSFSCIECDARKNLEPSKNGEV
jgi:hypothetical protein